MTIGCKAKQAEVQVPSSSNNSWIQAACAHFFNLLQTEWWCS